MNQTDQDRRTPPPPGAPPAADKPPPDDAGKGNLDLDDRAQINNQHLEVR